MALSLANRLSALLQLPVLAFSTCWKVERLDGTVFRFTDHDHKLTVENEEYTPVGGFSPSAIQHDAGLEDRNRELVGVLVSSAITFADLQAGLYQGAKITERLVDRRWPWAGPFATRVYWVGETAFTGERWEANLAGLTGRLQRAVGDVFVRSCRVDLFSAKCGVTKASHEFTGSVSSIVTQRRKIRTSTLGSPAKDDGWFDEGDFEWTSGNNSGVKGEVRSYLKTNSEIEFYIATPKDIQVGDGFKIWTGCDHKKATCKAKFSNLVNFRGFQFIPGADAAFTTPDSR